MCPLILILTSHNSCSGKAKPSNKAKVNKPVEDPKVSEPEQQTAASEAFVPQPSEPVFVVPPEIPGSSIDQANDNPLNTEASSPVKTAETHDDDVVITNTGFREPGRPTILAKHSAEEEHIKRQKVRFDVASYSQMSIGEVYSGYLNQVHTSRDLEVDMVKQMHKKYEV